ncbi:MAG TPA: L,D-transpeptidase family protein [Puia sp.]|nr:L,D-transpeptidase family protein [Puia sp.]
MSRWGAILWLALLGRSPVTGPPLRYAHLVDRFYRQRNHQLFWFASGTFGAESRRVLLAAIDSAAWQGLDSNRYDPAGLRALEAPEAGVPTFERDARYTDAALSLGFDLYCGSGIESMIGYDGVSPRFAARDAGFMLARLIDGSTGGLSGYLDSLEPRFAGYRSLKHALGQYIDSAAGSRSESDVLTGRFGNFPHYVSRIRQLEVSLNFFRWMHHFGFDRFVIVNVAGAGLRYYAGDSLALQMRIIAGQVSKRTPRFAAWIDGLVLYPYWNIPRRIAVNEWLPLFRRRPEAAALMEIEVLDSHGRRIDPSSIDWRSVRAADFPYTLRQAPGCFNALGVLKFDVSDPFDVYMHDTNVKSAFASSSRYLSHGCIRLEKAALLGDVLLDHGLDTALLSACLRHQEPTPIRLARPVPVFVLYLTVVPDGSGGLLWLKDIYHLWS